MTYTRTFQLTATAAFLALIIAFDLLGIGLISLGFINITTLCVLVVTGTMILGLKSGLVLGACFGLLSTLSAFGITKASTGLVIPLVAANPLMVIALCIVPRLCVPVVTHFVYRALRRTTSNSKPYAAPIAAVSGSVTNTILYLGLMLLFYVLSGFDAQPVLGTIAMVAGSAGIGEAIAAGVIAMPVVAAVERIGKKE